LVVQIHRAALDFLVWFFEHHERKPTMARTRTHSSLVDHFSEPLEPGRWYGLKAEGDPATRATPAQCTYVLRDRVWFLRRDGSTISFTQTTASGVVFILLDNLLREVTRLPNEAVERRVAEMKRMFLLLEARAARKRKSQEALIRKTLALWGTADPGENLRDAVASFIRDEHSHVTAETLAQAYRDAITGGQ